MRLGCHPGTARRRGLTLPELLIAMGVMGILAYACSTIYFSVLGTYTRHIWALPPYDAATAAVQRVTRELREAMLIDAHGDTFIVVIIPQKDANRDNVLELGENGYQLVKGNYVAYYLSDDSGALGAQGHDLWKAVRAVGGTTFVPRVKIAENIHPELNPVDPDTGLPRSMFKYWPDDVRLWGVEAWMTSTGVVRGETRTQTAHSECYLRNR